MISVIVITYNQEKTIARALDSILGQQCHLPVEIIIGEDCSTDRTREICQAYAARYPQQIRLFCNTYNKGVVDNYFDCLLSCRGRFIADCAGDDFWVDDLKLEKEARLMEANERITLVHTAWRYYDETTCQVSVPPAQPFPAPLTDGRLMLEAILTQTNRPVIHLCTALYRAETILRIYRENTSLFRDKEAGCEDLTIAFFLAREGLIAYLPDITLNYSRGNESVSAPENEASRFVFYKRVTHLSYLLSRKYNIESKAVERFFKERVFTLFMHAFRMYSPQLRNDAIDCQRQWKAGSTCKIRFIRIVMRYRLPWRLALHLRKYLR